MHDEHHIICPQPEIQDLFIKTCSKQMHYIWYAIPKSKAFEQY